MPLFILVALILLTGTVQSQQAHAQYSEDNIIIDNGYVDAGTSMFDAPPEDLIDVAAPSSDGSYELWDDESSLHGNVLNNDSDAAGHTLRVELDQDVQHGQLRLKDDGTFTYLAPPDYVDHDSFTYVLKNGVEDSYETVYIQFDEQYPIDIDGQDATTEGIWMSEEDEYDLCVAISEDSYASLHTSVSPTFLGSDSIVERVVRWDPTYLSINGDSSGELSLDPMSGDETLLLTQHAPGFQFGTVEYTLAYMNGPFLSALVQAINTCNSKSYLYEVDITSEHGMLRENTTDLLSDAGSHYPEIEYKRNLYDDVPISHTWDSFVYATVRFRSSEIEVGTQYRIRGSSEGLTFVGPVETARQRAIADSNVVSTNKLPKKVSRLSEEIEWTLEIIDPITNAPSELHTEAVTHEIFVTAGTPRETGGKATYIRMEQSVFWVGKAMREIANQFPNPTPARMVFETLRKNHRFNASCHAGSQGRNPSSLPFPQVSPRGSARFWLVPTMWQDPECGGADCFSGATWTSYVTNMVGIEGTITATRYDAVSFPDHTTAKVYTNIQRMYVPPPGGSGLYQQRELMLMSGANVDNAAPNRYEGTVVYTSADQRKTFYFPVGPGWDRRYDDKDHVLYAFNHIAWVIVDGPIFASRKYDFYPDDPKKRLPPNVDID